MEIINVIVIKEGIVDTCQTFVAKFKAEVNVNVQLAELKFAEIASEYGVNEDDMESHIEDGYYARFNFAICLVHSEIQ